MFTFNLVFVIIIIEPLTVSVVCSTADSTKGRAVICKKDTTPPGYLALANKSAIEEFGR